MSIRAEGDPVAHPSTQTGGGGSTPSSALLFDTRPTVPLMEIDPKKIAVRRVSIRRLSFLQPMCSQATWRPAPGRKMAFIVSHGPTEIGLLFLASPVVNLGCRDKHLRLPTDPSERASELRHYADLSVCVGMQPLSWHWNIGKLIAMMACTLGDEYQRAYGDELKGICTTSLYGRGSQYNRVYKFLGYTKGFGHEHIGDTEYRRMIWWMRRNGVPVPSCKFGEGSNPRMRRIAAYRRASGDQNTVLFHGHKRGVYYHPAVPPSSRQSIIEHWYARWGLPRYERTKHETPPYVVGANPEVYDVLEPTKPSEKP